MIRIRSRWDPEGSSGEGRESVGLRMSMKFSVVLFFLFRGYCCWRSVRIAWG